MTSTGSNHVAEWFGHRVFPAVTEAEEARDDRSRKLCPFLTEATERDQPCVKRENSKGVCTISSSSNGKRQDWLVCPFRALDPNLLYDAARRLFGIGADDLPLLVAAPVLANEHEAAEFRTAVRAGRPAIAYFQNKLGGEISLQATDRSPEFSFDATMVEVLADGDRLAVGRYGIFEIQTMDFHGTYANAVKNLNAALHLHKEDFGTAVGAHPRWLSEKVEGPNLSNVFKRTFYQMMFKFQLGLHERSAGCIFAVPQAVWDSWQRHLGQPELLHRADGTSRLAVPEEIDAPSKSWIYVFDVEVSSTTSPNVLVLNQAISTSAAALSHYALARAPAAAMEPGGAADKLIESVESRLGLYLPEFKRPRPRRARPRADVN